MPQRSAVGGGRAIRPALCAIRRRQPERRRRVAVRRLRSHRAANARAAASAGRPSFADELRRPAPALFGRRSDPLTGFTPGALTPLRPARRRDGRLRLPNAHEPIDAPLRAPEPPKAPPPHQRRPRFPRAPNAPRRPAASADPVQPPPNKISPRWRSASKPRYAGRPATASEPRIGAPRWRPNRRRSAPPRHRP